MSVVSMLGNLAPYPERRVKHDGLTIANLQQQIRDAAKTTTKSTYFNVDFCTRTISGQRQWRGSGHVMSGMLLS